MEYDVEKISNKIKNKIVTKKIFRYIILNILIILFIVNLILSFEENTHFFGIYMFNIVSESMEPTLSVNDVVIVYKTEISELHEGDIITFLQDNRTISHRIKTVINEKNNVKYITKGDNNEVVDPYRVEAKDVYGKVIFSIKGIGKVVDYIQNVSGFVNIAIFVIIVYILVNIKDKQKINRKMKRKKYEIKKKRDNYYL